MKDMEAMLSIRLSQWFFSLSLSDVLFIDNNHVSVVIYIVIDLLPSRSPTPI